MVLQRGQPESARRQMCLLPVPCPPLLGGGMQSHVGYHGDRGRRVATHCHAIARNNSARCGNPGGIMPEPTEGPTVLRILLGTQLRRLRESRGITAQEAARAIRGSESKISRIE